MLAVLAVRGRVLDAPVLSTAATEFVAICVQAMPFLVLGVVVSGAIAAFVPPESLRRMVPRNRAAAVGVAGLAGMALPGCECASVPVANRLMRQGVPPSAAVAFLLSAPAVNPVVLVATAVAFPTQPRMVLARFLASLLTAVTVGYLWSRRVNPSTANLSTTDPSTADPPTAASAAISSTTNPPPAASTAASAAISSAAASAAISLPATSSSVASPAALPTAISSLVALRSRGRSRSSGVDSLTPLDPVDRSGSASAARLTGTARLAVFVETARTDLVEAGGFLVIGALTAATLNVLIPPAWFATVGHHPVAAIPILAALAVVLALCSEADAFVAASLTSLPLLPRLVFLVVGPAVDVKLIAMQAGAFGRAFAARLAPLTFTVATASAVLVGLCVL